MNVVCEHVCMQVNDHVGAVQVHAHVCTQHTRPHRRCSPGRIRCLSVGVLGTHSGWGRPSPGPQPSSQTSLQGRRRDGTGAGPRLAGGLQVWDGGTSGAWPVLSGVPSGLFHTRCPLPTWSGLHTHTEPPLGPWGAGAAALPAGGFERAAVSLVSFCLLECLP